MAVKLSVYKHDENEPEFVKSFSSENITIGRDQSADLTLEDPSKFVSREHAVISYQDGYYYLLDKESRNGTYINDKRIKAEYPYTLDEGASFVIGEYTIRISLQEQVAATPPPPPPASDRTMVYSNPFQDEMDQLVEVLTRIEEKHQSSKELASQASLEEALESVKQSTKNFETQSVIFAGSKNGGTEPAQATPAPKEVKVASGGDPRLHKILDVSLEFFVNVFRFVSKFRTEFVGSTLVQTEEIMSVQNVEGLKGLLFDETLSDEQLDERIGQIRIEMRKLVAHQMGLLEGYRDSVKQGVPKLTKELNPAIALNEISNETLELGPIKVPYKFIPFIVKKKAFRQLEEKHFALTEEDRGVIEKKYFRPPFIKKYLETISSS